MYQRGRHAKKVGGFTLLEMLIVVSLLGGLSVFGLIVGMESYRSYMFHSDRDMLIAVLQKARSQSINNICIGTSCTNGKSHGVYIDGDTFTLFQGSNYPSRDIYADEEFSIARSALAVSTSSLTEVVFKQLSAEVSTPGIITLSDGMGNFSKIIINSEGGISWKNE